MTRVIYEPDAFALRLEGHAGYAPPEEDLVCAGISALWNALEQSLTASQATVRVFRPVFVYGDGIRRAECCPDEEAITECRAMLRVIAVGLRWMAEKFPECVSFEVRRRGDYHSEETD